MEAFLEGRACRAWADNGECALKSATGWIY